MRAHSIVYLIIAAVGSSAATAKPLAVQTSVYSRVAPDYQRKKLPSGMLQKELYAVSNGGLAPGTTVDSSVEKVSFPMIAGVVAEHLGRQNYFLAPDSKSAQLLLVIQWGRTIPHNGLNYSNAVNNLSSELFKMRLDLPDDQKSKLPAGLPFIAEDTSGLDGALMLMDMENRLRYRVNEQNARLLGYIDAINDADGISRYAGGGGDRFTELFEDIEETRYYILVRAYEFRAAVEKREKNLLWVTRISVAARGTDFDESLRPMIARAAPYFGHPTKRLIREFKGTVELGDSSVIEVNADLPGSGRKGGSETREISK
jgi:hypothetical protein